METKKLYLRIDPTQIHYLKFLLEGYDGMAILSTVDVRQGLVLLRFPEESMLFLFGFLADVSEKIRLKHSGE